MALHCGIANFWCHMKEIPCAFITGLRCKSLLYAIEKIGFAFASANPLVSVNIDHCFIKLWILTFSYPHLQPHTRIWIPSLRRHYMQFRRRICVCSSITSSYAIIYILKDFKNDSPTIMKLDRLGLFIFTLFLITFIHNEDMTMQLSKVKFVQLQLTEHIYPTPSFRFRTLSRFQTNP